MRVVKAIQRRMQRNSERSSANHNNGNGSNNNKSNGWSNPKKTKQQNKQGNNNNGVSNNDVPRTVETKPQRENASVIDFQDLKTLKAVLMANDPNHGSNNNNHGSLSVIGSVGDNGSINSGNNTSHGGDDSSLGDHSGGMISNASERSSSDPLSFQPVEWTLPLVDKENTEPQTMEQEFQRLQVLQSYFVLDTQGEVEFDRITRHTAKLFNVPICLISLVDLGRQWFLSKVGLDATETPRKYAFCAHVILNKHKQLIVPDASQDVRFQNNPLVADPDGLKIRFYAGAALISPEGYKLGTLCIISPQVRLQGLSVSEQETLHELAAMVVSTMVARRTRLLKEEYETKFLQLAQTFLDTHHNLQTAQASIQSVLERQPSWNTPDDSFDNDTMFELSATVKNLAVQSQICAAATRTVLQEVPSLRQHPAAAVQDQPPDQNGDNNDPDAAHDDPDDHDEYGNMPPQVVNVLGDDGNREEENGLLFLDSMMQYDKIVNPTTDMQKLFDNLNGLVGQFPHSNIVTLELYKSVPKHLIAEDLLLFRSILNLLTHCMGASQLHSCGLRIRNKKTSHGTNANELLIHCLQGGPLVPYVRAKELFHNPDSLLAPVATMVRTLGGQYGMFQGRWDRPKPTKKTSSSNAENTDPSSSSSNNNNTANKGGKLQSIYWLQIPYELPSDFDDEQQQQHDQMSASNHTAASSDERFRRTQLQVHRPSEGDAKNNKNAALAQGVGGGSSNNNLKSDPFLQASLLDIGCGSHGTARAASSSTTTTSTRVPRTASRAQ